MFRSHNFPALITTSVVGRMRLRHCFCLLHSGLWIVYYPMAHMVWGEDGFLAALGSVDFAGGNVVHISSGVSALVLAICLGRRRGYETHSHRIQHPICHSGLHHRSGSDGLASMPEVLLRQMDLHHAFMTSAMLLLPQCSSGCSLII